MQRDFENRGSHTGTVSRLSAGGRGTDDESASRSTRSAALRGKSYAQQVAALSPRGESRQRDPIGGSTTSAAAPGGGRFPEREELNASIPSVQLGSQSHADQKVLTPEMLQFSSQLHAIANYQPSTGLGLFDARYDTNSQELVVTVRCMFRFLSESPRKFPGFQAGEFVWDEAAKSEWKKGFMDLISQRWGRQDSFRCLQPGLERLKAAVRVEVVEAEKDWRFRLDVRRIPKGAWASSSVSAFKGSRTEANHATLDSEDQRPADKGGSEGQLGAVHEFGHMVGLGDEYGSGKDIAHRTLVKDALGREIQKETSDNVMSSANKVEKQHYVTFLEALKKATGLETWVFAE